MAITVKPDHRKRLPCGHWIAVDRSVVGKEPGRIITAIGLHADSANNHFPRGRLSKHTAETSWKSVNKQTIPAPLPSPSEFVPSH